MTEFTYHLEYIGVNKNKENPIFKTQQPVKAGDLIESHYYHVVISVIHSQGNNDEAVTILLLSEDGQSPAEAYLLAQQAGHLKSDQWPFLPIDQDEEKDLDIEQPKPLSL